MATENSTKTSKGRITLRHWSGLSLARRMVICFSLMTLATMCLAFAAVSVVWGQHFQEYTEANLTKVSSSVAKAVGQNYERMGWTPDTIYPAKAAVAIDTNLAVRITDSEGVVRYDNSPVEGDLRWSNKEPRTVASPIVVKDQFVGTVSVWVYGSDTYATQADEEFRSKCYSAMTMAMILAFIISIFVGAIFANYLATPIRRITSTAKSIKEGNLAARCGITGDDEVSRLGSTLDEMADAIEHDRQTERHLITDVAHELRTPLMAIQSTVEAMVDGVFEPNQENLSTINSEVARLKRLVDALLKLSRLEDRKTPFHKQKLDLIELLDGIVTTHEAFVRDSGLDFTFKHDDDVIVYGDPDMIRQATANLISNAVRYTEEGGVHVTVLKGETMASIEVRDTGIGLSPDEAKMVFSRFWRADSGRNREQGGLGIGLSIVKEIVERHNGWVRVEGEKGVGATFTIFIPLYDESRDKSLQQNAKGDKRRKRKQSEQSDGKGE